MSKSAFGWIILVALQSWAHGEHSPGPHGGFISMPGAFHVELVPISKRQMHAYLLDIEWKKPTLADSSINMSLGPVSAKCSGEGDHFVCDFPPSVDLSRPGELKVDATREKQRGNTVNYSLPLTFKKEH